MWILPTRKREALCQRFLDAAESTGMSTPGLVYIDGCPEYRLNVRKNWMLYYGAAQIELCAALQWFFEWHSDLAWYGVVNDDHVPATAGWDKRLIEAAGDWHIAHCDDGWMHGRNPSTGKERLTGAIVFGGELLRAIGFFALPGMVHLHIDDVWEDIARRIDAMKYLPDVLVEHRHFATGKAQFDQTYERVFRGAPYAAADRQVYERWRETELEGLLERLRQQIPGCTH